MGDMQFIQIIALAMGAAWASGINLYATVAMLGILGASGHLDLPEEMLFLTQPPVIMIAVFLYFVEFITDKIPAVDSLWDGLHTFIRIPAGAVLAAAAVGDVSPEAQFLALLAGGGLAATSHTLKAGTRAVINTSPEPFTNIAASIGEDILVIGGLAIALFSPTVFLAMMVAFLVFAIWLIPKIFRGIKRVFSFLTGGRGRGARDAEFEVVVDQAIEDLDSGEQPRQISRK